MQYIEKCGEKISRLGYGCMRFPKKGGMKTDLIATEKQILKAYALGVNYFDTAYLYMTSEEDLGYVLERNHLRNKIYIATKMPLMMVQSYEDFDELFNEQLRRLKTDYIDFYLMHNLSDYSTWEKLRELGIEKWIAEKKASGEIKHIGFSSHAKEDIFFKILNTYDWEFSQIQYNYMNENYQAGKRGLQAISDKGIMSVIMEPLLGGKLANSLPKPAMNIIEDKFADKNPAEVAFQWLYNHQEVDVVLSGMNSIDMIEENANMADTEIGSLSKEELEEYPKIVEAFKQTYKIPCTGCNYCQPCPKGVDISTLFSAYNMSYTLGRIEGIKQYMVGHLGNNCPKNQCAKCHKCEGHCPQDIKIVEEIERASKRIQPWYVTGAGHIAAKLVRPIIMKRNRK